MRFSVHASALCIGGLLLGIAAGVQATRLAPAPHGQAAAAILAGVTVACGALVVLAAVAMILVSGAAVVTLQQGFSDEEEPVLPQPRVPACRRRSPLIGLVDLEPGAGASTLAFNLAVLIATSGTSIGADGAARRPRPLCLLSGGPLAGRLGLTDDPFREHLARNSGRIAETLVDDAVRHPSGCELLCIPTGRIGRHQLRLLRQALDPYYDLLVVEGAFRDPNLREGVEDTADVLLGVGLPTDRSESAIQGFLEGALVRMRWPTTAILLNQVRGGQRPAAWVWEELGNLGAIPYQAAIGPARQVQMPWSLAPASPAAHALRNLAGQLLPELLPEGHRAVLA